ncbi:MAG: aldo/keto reductase [Croceicoccus sp.]|nr:aldo/keto reductase [Croceicoccus sp.]MAL26230.1 aldo/keto reductase [Croceicoccus sp.]|tara:strand:- start:48229 stop:49272 length:1044 start_codon:yes stop_codon:yes gene_type:complete
MRYNRLGRTGLFVSELCLGTMTFGEGEGMFKQMGALGQSDVNPQVKAAVDGGINFIDTADVYSAGKSEEAVGRAIRDLGLNRDELVIATKALGPMGEDVNARGASRFHLLNAIDASLDRLGMDHVDLYQIHGWDPATPLEETLRALDTIVQSGRARYVGVSNWAAWQIARAIGKTEQLGLAPLASLQAYYSLVGRDLEHEIAPMLEAEGLGLMVWSPLAGGFLSGKYRRGQEGEGRRASFDFPPVDKDKGYDAVEVMDDIAASHGATVPQVALAWLLAKPAVSTVIIGARKLSQLQDNLGASDVRLSEDDIARLDAAYAPPMQYPGWMLKRQGEYRKGGQIEANFDD